MRDAARHWTRRRLIATAGAGLLATPLARAAALGDAVAWPRVQLLDGRWRAAADWHDQAVVLVFFATWCAHCRRHNQRVARLQAAAHGRPLRVLGVAQSSPAAAIPRYLAELPAPLEVTLDEQPLHAATDARRSVPLTCVVDRQGRLREVIPGEMAEDDVMGLLKWA